MTWFTAQGDPQRLAQPLGHLPCVGLGQRLDPGQPAVVEAVDLGRHLEPSVAQVAQPRQAGRRAGAAQLFESAVEPSLLVARTVI